MPPRKRRGRSSSTPTASPPPPALAASSHFSPKTTQPAHSTSLPAAPPPPPPPPPQAPHIPHPSPEALASALKSSQAHPNSFTLPAVTLHLYNHLIDWAITNVAVRFKHNLYLTAEANRHLQLLHPPPTTRNPPTHNPRLLYSDKNVTVECSNCSANVSASRYAQHVEKCLGRGGRTSSRTASARLRASAERERRERDMADIDDPPARRRRHADHADPPFPPIHSKRRKMSPVPAANSAAAAHAALHHRSAALPPSGRTRSSPP